MARKEMDIHIRIKRQEDKILQLTHQLEEEKEKYSELQKELEEAVKQELYQAFRKSKRNYEEVLEFLKGKADI